MIQCAAPDPQLGVTLRLAGYLDCEARALGENGFQALAGSPAITATISALVTVFVALIGYRLILGFVPGVRDAVGWAVRLGIVLALVTSWPAFQTLIFRVVTDGPAELAAVILPAAGLPVESIDERIQGAYDRIRLGPDGGGDAGDLPQAQAQTPAPGTSVTTSATAIARIATTVPPLPRAAALLVVSTAGLIAALRLSVGFLIAVGPLAILGLLFDGTLGLFEGWLRMVLGAALGVLGATVTTAIELVMVESELAHIDAVQVGMDAGSSFDPQAITTLLLLFGGVALAVVYASIRVMSALCLPRPLSTNSTPKDLVSSVRERTAGGIMAPAAASSTQAPSSRARSTVVAEALSAAAFRDQRLLVGAGAVSDVPTRQTDHRQQNGSLSMIHRPLGAFVRRTGSRRTASARRRDRPA